MLNMEKRTSEEYIHNKLCINYKNVCIIFSVGKRIIYYTYIIYNLYLIYITNNSWKVFKEGGFQNAKNL
ncbi:Uncharacterised protein [uncultured archaeon]|nr:Uncharacterised protein [uncultured archaeon]